MKIDFAVGFKTDIGRKRALNQDDGIALPGMGLFIVSDGMGGHKGGETASATAVSLISLLVRESLKDPGWGLQKTLHDAISAANAAIFQMSKNDSSLTGMGTTTTALLFKGTQLAIGHVGDSRCYFFRPNAIWQTTRDHSLVQEKLRAGIIQRSAVKTDRMKNVITRSVGFEERVQIDIYEMANQAGHCFMLCSDGLSGELEDPQILSIVQKLWNNPKLAQPIAEELVECANNHGGGDNITAVVVHVLAIHD